ncbi:MAG: hypothetical protein IJX76_04180 [Clostridia bacterium]|nr:hypothetical protein [Clostridia bacterium]
MSGSRRFIRALCGVGIAVQLLSLAGCSSPEPLEIPAAYGVSEDPSVGYLHFSVDDCNTLFRDLTENADRYDSIFDQPTLGFVRELHDQFGIRISFYVYYCPNRETVEFDLSDATDRFSAEFAENADWLRFGYHAPDSEAYQSTDAEEQLEYYRMTVRELIRITGSAECIDNFVRLDRYLADADTVRALSFAEEGITGLFIADRSNPDRHSYALSQAAQETCYAEDWWVEEGVCYTPTDVRLEDIADDDAFYRLLKDMEEQPRLIVFTHEWAMEQESVKRYMRWFAEYAHTYGIPSAFPENENDKPA